MWEDRFAHRLCAKIRTFYIKDLGILGLWYTWSGEVPEPIPTQMSGDDCSLLSKVFPKHSYAFVFYLILLNKFQQD